MYNKFGKVLLLVEAAKLLEKEERSLKNSKFKNYCVIALDELENGKLNVNDLRNSMKERLTSSKYDIDLNEDDIDKEEEEIIVINHDFVDYFSEDEIEEIIV
jgi:DNA-directed RNA polymerase subunit K/omega